MESKLRKKISVIIPCYNASKTLRPCVLSVMNTNFSSLEILLVDDLSTDSTPQIISDLCGEFPKQVHSVKQITRGGPSKARNAGANKATGHYLFFLDSDTVMATDALDNFLLRINSVDAVVGIYEAEPLNPGIVSRYKAYLNHYFFSRSGVIPYEVFDSSRAGIKADIFHELGGYNTSLKWGMDFENEELGYRVIKKYKMVLDPSIHVGHHFPGFIGLTKTYFKRVAQWMEIFMLRRKFESGGVTSASTGLSSASLLFSLISLFGIISHPMIGLLSLVFFLIYLRGYWGFFLFVAQKRITHTPLAMCLNFYFTLVLALGALFGCTKALTGQSQIPDVIGH